mmetsp:Transcript_17133/g.24933  ORF Transcript_17133/g.24933 Transcript_17133/m.24933 type:complete len:483 (+) Transcript_17133:88-1536(+)
MVKPTNLYNLPNGLLAPVRKEQGVRNVSECLILISFKSKRFSTLWHTSINVNAIEISKVFHVHSSIGLGKGGWYIFLNSGLNLLKKVNVLNSQSILDRSHHSHVEGLSFTDVVSTVQKSCIEQVPKSISDLNRWLLFSLGDLVEQVINEWVTGIDLKCLGSKHERVVISVREGLGLHESLHIGGISVFSRGCNSGSGFEPLGDLNLAYSLSVELAHELGKRLVFGLVRLFDSLVEVLILIIKLDALVGDGGDLLRVEFTHVAYHVLISGLGEVDNLYVLLVELLHERTLLHLAQVVPREEVDAILPVLHVGNVVLETDPVLARLASFETDQFGKSLAVRFIFNDSHFEGGLELLVPFNVGVDLLLFLLFFIVDNDISISVNFGISVFFLLLMGLIGKLLDHINNLPGCLLPNDSNNLGFLKRLTVDIQRQIIRIDHTGDETHVTWQKLKLIGNENLPHIQLHFIIELGHITTIGHGSGHILR